jgi:hypothetical protein
MRTGSASAIRAFAESDFNIDPFAPKEVEITLEYDFVLAIPSLLQLAPGVTVTSKGNGKRAFRIRQNQDEDSKKYFTVRLQSTGGRRSILAFMPKVPDLAGSIGGRSFETVPNTPLYWRMRASAKKTKGGGSGSGSGGSGSGGGSSGGGGSGGGTGGGGSGGGGSGGGGSGGGGTGGAGGGGTGGGGGGPGTKSDDDKKGGGN